MAIRFMKSLIVRNFWQNSAFMNSLRLPILFICSAEDQVVPQDHTRKLHALATNAAFKELYIVNGAKHADAWEIGGSRYFKTIT